MSSAWAAQWQQLLTSFFGFGNDLTWPSDNEVVQQFVAANSRNLDRDPAGPFILPRVASGQTTYYALAVSDEQVSDLRMLIHGFIGSTYSTFDGRFATTDEADPVFAAAVRFTGSPQRVFTFTVAGPQNVARRAVRGQVLLLLEMLRQRPDRSVRATRPIGRLLRDFELALESGDASGAEGLLFGPISESGRLSNANRLFLQVRLLGTFGRWDELSHLASLPDVLRINRPAAVSDVLAQLAVRNVPTGADSDTELLRAWFEVDIAPVYGALIESTDRIRSEAGALYYTLWQLTHAESAAALSQRLDGLAWLDTPAIAELLRAGETSIVPSGPEPTAADIVACIADGRFETALELISSTAARSELIQPLLVVVRRLLSDRSFTELERYRTALGAAALDSEIQAGSDFSALSNSQERMPVSWSDRFRALTRREVTLQQLSAAIDESGLTELVRDHEALLELTDAVQQVADADATKQVVEAGLKLSGRLHDVVPERDHGRLKMLRLTLLQLWALQDESGDLSIASDVIDEVERLLRAGCSASEFDEIVEFLVAAWANFLTDNAFGLSIRALEVLVGGQPSSSSIVNSFAGPLLARVTTANAERLDSADVTIAQALSDELGLGFELPRPTLVDDDRARLDSWRGLIGLYSLDENALHRARTCLSSMLPHAEIRIAHDKVSSQPLLTLAASASIMVIAWQSAKHSATDAIRGASTTDPVYALGKGSTSLVRAVTETLLQRSQVGS